MHVRVEHHRVPEAELRDRGGRTDRVQQLAARVDGVSDRDQMLVKFPRSDRVEQLALGILERSIPAIGAKASLDLRIHGERSRPTSCPPDRTNST